MANTDISPDVTAYIADARALSITRYGNDVDAAGILDVLITHIEEIHSGANIGLSDIKNLLSDLDDVTKFLKGLLYTRHLLAQRLGLSPDEV